MSNVVDSQTNYHERAEVAADLLPLAVAQGGTAFGGFVRDYVIRRSNWKDLDLWFKTAQTANSFLQAMIVSGAHVVELDRLGLIKYEEQKLDEKAIHFINCASYEYPYERMLVFVTDVKSRVQMYVDMVVCATFPVDDFDVNQVSWDGNASGIVTSHHATLNADQLRAQILAGTATMLPGYDVRAKEYVRDKNKPNDFLQQRMDKLWGKGFTITNPPAYIKQKKPKPVEDDVPVSDLALVTASLKYLSPSDMLIVRQLMERLLYRSLESPLPKQVSLPPVRS